LIKKREQKREWCCEEQGFIVVVYISLLEQLEASGGFSHRELYLLLSQI